MKEAPKAGQLNASNEEVQIPEGLQKLVSWYADYAKEVVVDRAIVGIDGFKPVHRRILYAMRENKAHEMTKSAKVVGWVLGYHPHGDQSVYESLIRMVDSSMYMNIPFIKGKGSWGKVYSTEPAAAMRYTNCMLHENAALVFDGMDGIKMIPTEDGSVLEPELLPVAFPNVLCNPNSGIAVGMASNIPSFNFHEVLNATIELIETGDIKGVLAPDFTTKGHYVYDESELRKIMERGRGRIKLRGKWTVDGKKIVITEIPYYTTVNALAKQAKELKDKGVPISDIKDLSDRQGLRLEIECSNKKVVDEVLTSLVRDTDLQMSMTTNFTVIVDGRPRVLGIKDLLREWVKFRKGVLKTSLEKEYALVLRDIPRYELLVDLLSDENKRNEFIQRLTKQNSAHARAYLRELYPDADESIFTWILDMPLKSLSGVASKESRLANLYARKAELEADLANIEGVITRQLKKLNTQYSFPRRTEVTDVDYNFEKEKPVVVKAAPTPTLVIIEDKFIKKLRLSPATEHLDGIRCMSDDVISFIDTHGRLLRVNLEHLDYVTERDRGVYLPVYLEVEDDFEVVAYNLIEDKKIGYVYSDGFASVVDYSEWVDSKRMTRITHNGVSPYAGLIVGEIDLSKQFILLMTRKNYFGFVSSDFKHKGRTARTKLINVKKGDEIVLAVSVSYTDILKLVSNPQRYMDRLGPLAYEDVFDTEYLSTLLS